MPGAGGALEGVRYGHFIADHDRPLGTSPTTEWHEPTRHHAARRSDLPRLARGEDAQGDRDASAASDPKVRCRCHLQGGPFVFGAVLRLVVEWY